MTRLHASASQLSRRPAGALHRRTRPASRGAMLQRAVGNHAIADAIRDGMAAPAHPLDFALRTDMERRLGHDFSKVRVHVDGDAAARVHARAFAFGDDIVLASPEEQRTLPHELVHVAQQRGRALTMPTRLAEGHEPAERVIDAVPASDALYRTPDDKVSCAPGPLTLSDGTKIANPVNSITVAEIIGIHWLRDAIESLAYTLGRIRGGAPIAWPTISDSLAKSMRLVGLNPSAKVVWNDSGPGTAEYVLNRLRAVYAVLGSGTIYFHCSGEKIKRLSSCDEASPHICVDANAVNCSLSNEIALCEPFWQMKNLDPRARVVLHEHFHNESKTYGHTGRLNNVHCYERFAQNLYGVPEEHQKTHDCPDPH